MGKRKQKLDKVDRDYKKDINSFINGGNVTYVGWFEGEGAHGYFLELENGNRIPFSPDNTLTGGFRFYSIYSVDWDLATDYGDGEEFDLQALKRALVNWCLQVKAGNLGKGSAFTKPKTRLNDLDEKVVEFNPDDFEDAHDNILKGY